MKKFNISFRTYQVLCYTLSGLILLACPILLALIVVGAPNYDRWINISGAIVTLLISSAISFLFGFDAAKKKFRGRTIELQDLTWPGTVFPQSRGYFQFLGKQTLGGHSFGIFRKVTEPQTIVTGLSGHVPKKDLFCVISPDRLFPTKPCLLKITYDQCSRIDVTSLPDPDESKRECN